MSRLLADATFWVAVVCSLIAQVAIVRAAFVARGGGPGGGGAQPGWHRGREVTWAVVPGIVLAIVLYCTWRAVHPPPPPSGPASAASGAEGVRVAATVVSPRGGGQA